MLVPPECAERKLHELQLKLLSRVVGYGRKLLEYPLGSSFHKLAEGIQLGFHQARQPDEGFPKTAEEFLRTNRGARFCHELNIPQTEIQRTLFAFYFLLQSSIKSLQTGTLYFFAKKRVRNSISSQANIAGLYTPAFSCQTDFIHPVDYSDYPDSFSPDSGG